MDRYSKSLTLVQNPWRVGPGRALPFPEWKQISHEPMKQRWMHTHRCYRGSRYGSRSESRGREPQGRVHCECPLLHATPAILSLRTPRLTFSHCTYSGRSTIGPRSEIPRNTRTTSRLAHTYGKPHLQQHSTGLVKLQGSICRHTTIGSCCVIC